MKQLINIFLKGLLVVVPLFVTFGLLYWMFITTERLLEPALNLILPNGYYIPGLGVAALIGVTFLCGLLVRNILMRPFFHFMDWALSRIPVVNALYKSSRDLMQFAVGERQDEMRKVVSVEVTKGVTMLGFVTNEAIEQQALSHRIAVFFPMSYQMGGYLLYVDKEQCTPVDLSVEKAMQLILTAHMVNQ